MANILKDFSKQGQVILTTHSPVFIDKSDTKHTYLFYKEDGETKVKMPSKEEGSVLWTILDELGIRPSDVFLADYLIFVEGPTEVELFRKLLNNLQEFKDYNIAFLHMGGGGNVKHFLDKGVEELYRINRNIAIILDGDKYGKYEKLKNLENQGIKVVYTEREGERVREIENLFSEKVISEEFNIPIYEIRINKDTDVPLLIRDKMRKNYPMNIGNIIR